MGEQMEDAVLNQQRWLMPALGSSFCWAMSDVLCDICIEEDPESDSDFSESDSEYENEDMKYDNGYSKVKTEDDDNSDHVVEKWKRSKASSISNFSPRHRNSIQKNATAGIVSKARPRSNSPKDKIETDSVIEMVPMRLNKNKNTYKMGASGERMDNYDKDLLIAKDHGHDHDNNKESHGHIDGEQDAAVAGFVSTVFSYMVCLRRLSMFFDKSSLGTKAQAQTILWSPTEDIEWWFAAAGGVLLWVHYIFVLWAFDSAPSTVINPLVQVSSVWVLLGSAVPTALMGTTFIRPLDLFCYFVIVIGGILPSLNGNVRKMLTRKFWTKPFVRNVVLSEVTLGFYDLMVSYCLQASAKKAKFQDLAASALENEFFYVAWCSYSISFALSFAFIPRFNRKISELPYHIPIKILFFSAFSQCLTLLGFYFSAFAYAWFYQASVVHAAESSLQQAFNLIIAYMLRKLFNTGRESAIKGMRYKIISCVVVSFGLSLIAYQDQTAETTYFEYGEPMPTLDQDINTWPQSNDALPNNSSSGYDSHTRRQLLSLGLYPRGHICLPDMH
mmetsp:Transcript_19007/g.24179  ORF Transcript_19007/g.24179 Transcript_19007/m.24179 type:complete len:558 (+) Transcript_19007:199-1872(+)|eukprot:CAMPEP_0204860566 /NCGR_PEP_ID=MMETSP1348-20121228/579_1 /ASSEMBLY_ACC=CAM_ASM_000700 /TAXON_ID=215587 /ORGANISM="Aplanochytrium stocchinoi, Strain GSBS06" /LENGTH=557 /DNA_ID=CAMNT_0052009317 /DNA_START=63 /DNA_END=1736 /DNA_ORIENTATION=-